MEQIDRAEGAILGQAVGDMLGVPFEFANHTFTSLEGAELRGGGLGDYAPGEWSDDTQMMLYIAQVSANGSDLTSGDCLDQIAAGFLSWYTDGIFTDIGNQTRVLLAELAGDDGLPGLSARMRQAASDLHARTGRTAGNGALMRNAIIGLTRLGDPLATAASARAVAELTHADPLAAESCIIHAEIIRRSVLGRGWVIEDIVDLLAEDRRGFWIEALAMGDESVSSSRERFLASPTNPDDGFTVITLTKALVALAHGLRSQTPIATTISTAIAMSNDTDTVAAVAGSLVGAHLGASAIATNWVAALNGLPVDPATGARLTADYLRTLARATAVNGLADSRTSDH